MKFGNSAFNSKSYIAKSTTDGTLDFDYINSSGTSSTKSFSVNVPIKSWIFYIISFDSEDVYTTVLGENKNRWHVSGAKYDKPASVVIGFGYGIKAFLYEINYFATFIISYSPLTSITLSDNSYQSLSIDGLAQGLAQIPYVILLNSCLRFLR
ncbi:unnamed protein product [Blepharisma stoltei]|uniref:Uncharacterized protein n=1 Tax=Blepharisma stoltei TaxID=1481888 RepID=A0AAU9J6E3_9CILI|nr:unnamed protein product [Blepharisma stoltei]